MNLVLKAAFERDVDFVLARAFYEGNDAAQLFLKTGDKVLRVQHSAMELHGESDLQILVERNGIRHAILIEDKVDAPAQPDQYLRYCERGDRGKAEKRWDDYSVFIAAPQKYLESDREAKKYPNKVSYEEIRDTLVNDLFSHAVIETALKKSEGLLPNVVDEAVTAFWNEYYNYHEEHAPDLLLHINRGKKGPNATWPDFATKLRGVKILHKSEKGVVDLQFRGMGGKLEQLETMLPERDSDMKLVKAGNSAVVRIHVPNMDFSKDFAIYEREIAIVFDAVNRLNQFAIKTAEKAQLILEENV